jgi:hypothetical protein
MGLFMAFWMATSGSNVFSLFAFPFFPFCIYKGVVAHLPRPLIFPFVVLTSTRKILRAQCTLPPPFPDSLF